MKLRRLELEALQRIAQSGKGYLDIAEAVFTVNFAKGRRIGCATQFFNNGRAREIGHLIGRKQRTLCLRRQCLGTAVLIEASDRRALFIKSERRRLRQIAKGWHRSCAGLIEIRAARLHRERIGLRMGMLG